MAGEPDAAAAAAEALRDLRALATRLESLSGSTSSDAGAPAAAAGGGARQATRARALLSLVRLLQLYIAGDAAAAEPELAGELASVCGDAFAPPRAAAGGVEDHRDPVINPEEGVGAGGDAPWADRLLDVLLSLLARPATPLPSAPLRDAVEAVFRAFSDAITPTGTRVLWNARELIRDIRVRVCMSHL